MHATAKASRGCKMGLIDKLHFVNPRNLKKQF